MTCYSSIIIINNYLSTKSANNINGRKKWQFLKNKDVNKEYFSFFLKKYMRFFIKNKDFIFFLNFSEKLVVTGTEFAR